MRALRKGWCPGALRPMAARDGLLVRLRPRCGVLTASTAATVADLAERHGNGLFDLTARANLQMRGVRAAELPALHTGLEALGLLDASADAESVRNVIVSPLAGLHSGPDIRPVVAALEQRLVEDAALHALPGKFGFLVDDGSRPSLADVSADVRFDWTGAAFVIGLGGTRDSAMPEGTCAPNELMARAAEIAVAFLERMTSDARRMRDDLPSPVGDSFSRKREKESPRDIVGKRNIQADGLDDSAPSRIGGLTCLGLAAPFGRLDAAMLRATVRAARDEIRLTPWRVLLLPGATTDHVAGFITDPDDPRLSVAACVGASGCAQGTTDTHADAATLADALPARAGIALHVSGCEKGCARPLRTPLTLVARAGRYDLIRDGHASDAPTLTNLDLDLVEDILAQEPA